MTVETREQGAVKWKTYVTYGSSGGSIFFALFVLFMFLFVTLVKTFSDYFLAFWIGEGDGHGGKDISENSSLTAYAIIYAMTAVALILFQAIRGYFYNVCTLRSSSYMHHSLFDRVIRAPMQFFDSTPVGRVLNRFSKDLDGKRILICSKTYSCTCCCV